MLPAGMSIGNPDATNINDDESIITSGTGGYGNQSSTDTPTGVVAVTNTSDGSVTHTEVAAVTNTSDGSVILIPTGGGNVTPPIGNGGGPAIISGGSTGNGDVNIPIVHIPTGMSVGNTNIINDDESVLTSGTSGTSTPSWMQRVETARLHRLARREEKKNLRNAKLREATLLADQAQRIQNDLAIEEATTTEDLMTTENPMVSNHFNIDTKGRLQLLNRDINPDKLRRQRLGRQQQRPRLNDNSDLMGRRLTTLYNDRASNLTRIASGLPHFKTTSQHLEPSRNILATKLVHQRVLAENARRKALKERREARAAAAMNRFTQSALNSVQIEQDALEGDAQYTGVGPHFYSPHIIEDIL
jgi:hypothetical protein